MLKIPSKASVMISIVLSVLFFVILIAGAVVMPCLSDVLMDVSDNVGSCNEITAGGRLFVLVLAYMILLFMAVADAMLFSLLLRVKSGKVFTTKSVALIRGISWCAMFLCVVFGLLGIYFQLSFFVAFACLFLGICLRVTKNVIEEATEIKAEHDFTI